MKRPQMNALKQQWGDFTKWIVNKYNYENLHIEKAKITFTYYFPTKARHDADNMTPKFFMDGLTESGMIIDDDFKHIETLIVKGGYDKENPRMEVLIEIIE
jgi:Holliday junction resolvase RusA-like endonuclease